MTRLPQPEGEERSLYVTLTVPTRIVPAFALALFLHRRDWENVFLTVIVIGLTVLPAFVGRRYPIVIPSSSASTRDCFVENRDERQSGFVLNGRTT